MSGPFARPLPSSFDLVWRALEPLHGRLVEWLLAVGAPAAVASAAVELLMWGEFLLIAALTVRIVTRARAAQTVSVRAALAAAAAAVGLIIWTLQSSTPQIYEMFLRPDHLLLAGAVGLALEPLSSTARRFTLAALSALFLGHYHGVLALAVVGGGGLAGFALAQLVGPTRRLWLVGSQAAVVLAIIGICIWLRIRSPMQAMAVFGLAFFVVLRHISWASEFAAGVRSTARDYCFYLLFYPGASGLVGAPEVFNEFRQRNFGKPVQPDADVGRRLLGGVGSIFLARRIPISLEAVAASRDTLSLWALQLGYWVEVALFLMGAWALVDAVALLLGVRLRQNFARLLHCENPSDLWRSVRGTMTYWLVYHVYRPLGGNRGSQELHIIAALAVSLIWHLVGVPFLAIPLRPLHFAPLTIWAVINGAAIVGHVYVRRHRWHILPTTTPPWLRRSIHRGLTLVLASLAMLPNFQLGPNINGFIPYLRTLCGWPP